MDDTAHTLMLHLFSDIPDQWMAGKMIHKLPDTLVIAACSIIAGLESWTQMEDLGSAKNASSCITSHKSWTEKEGSASWSNGKLSLVPARHAVISTISSYEGKGSISVICRSLNSAKPRSTIKYT